ncbi:GNAT family N-acetyltransferase [Hasllibacter sp. MH4015]|uniref:GNAT family N-acetyltransferase n=1 Tax=Hasllibacter sp. MH4015 TaxID=2854029 RepID=UPI001CD22656|nr:GNAT family N-acetyltransferase [Hasllibacter sp. MH4015]
MIRLSNDPPPPETFAQMRASCGWQLVPTHRARAALDASLLHVTAWEGDALVGMARVVGDGVLNAYIQDVVVADSHRGKGIARAIVERLMADLSELLPKGTTIGLMAVAGVEPLYERAGFMARPDGPFGAGMTMEIT